MGKRKQKEQEQQQPGLELAAGPTEDGEALCLCGHKRNEHNPRCNGHMCGCPSFALEEKELTDTTTASDTESKTVEVTMERVTEQLTCVMTDAEVMERGEQLARAIELMESAESRKKAAARDEKAKEALASTLKLAILYRQEVRNVMCRQVPDFETGRVAIIREDTGALVRQRDLTSGERQMLLPLPLEDDQDQDVEQDHDPDGDGDGEGEEGDR
ncbi:MAG: hypothetical protein LLG20_24185 [Acidobacteriales bacterium]|nr:hypothetical protein [Terriglobales bacterium]